MRAERRNSIAEAIADLKPAPRHEIFNSQALAAWQLQLLDGQ
jgi:hypothetical protein